MNVKNCRRICSAIAVIGVFLCMMCGAFTNAFADSTKAFKLICETPDGVLRSANHWDVYRIGDSDGEKRTLTGVFADLPVEFNADSSTDLTNTARTLETYVRVKKIAPLKSGESDKNGELVFDGMENGLYLFVGKPIKLGIKSYVPVSFISEITPSSSSQVIIKPKYSSFLVAAGEDMSYSVKKVWTNGGTRITDHIIADIYCDGEFYESVILNDDNDWFYSWSADDFYIWDVVERDVPDGFKVVYRSNEWQYVIVNTLSTQQPGVDYPDSTTATTTTAATDTSSETTTTASRTGPVMNEEDDTTTSTESGTGTTTTTVSQNSTTTAASSNGSPTTTITQEKLPQTGQLWWPVPLLAAFGLLMTAIGFMLRPKNRS